ncbi:hypothetical protein D3C80_2051700 [compost metagenome]
MGASSPMSKNKRQMIKLFMSTWIASVPNSKATDWFVRLWFDFWVEFNEPFLSAVENFSSSK